MSFRGIACIYKVVEVLPTSNLISDFPSFRQFQEMLCQNNISFAKQRTQADSCSQKTLLAIGFENDLLANRLRFGINATYYRICYVSLVH
jgi:hypothetical protein